MNPKYRASGYGRQVTSLSHDVKKHGGGVNDLVTSHVNKYGGRSCFRRARDVNKYGRCPNLGNNVAPNLTLASDM